MALTQTQRQKCRLYLGRTRVNAQVDRTLENALNAVDAFDTSDPQAGAALQADIVAILSELGRIDTQINQHREKRTKFTKAEDVTFAGPMELVELRSIGRQLVGRLSSQLGVPVGRDVFSAGGALGGLMKQG